MDQRETQFLAAVRTWTEAESARIAASEAYRVAQASALSASTAKTDAARKADADQVTGELRVQRDLAEMHATAAHHTVIFYRGSAGERGAA